jgi:hypothetical protein
MARLMDFHHQHATRAWPATALVQPAAARARPAMALLQLGRAPAVARGQPAGATARLVAAGRGLIHCVAWEAATSQGCGMGG